MSQDQLIYFVDVLENLEVGSSVESRLFNFVYKKNKIKIYINDSRCTSEHKTYYFQESCKRRLSFVILEDEKSEITSALKRDHIENQLLHLIFFESVSPLEIL